jgi:hypothetical protein
MEPYAELALFVLFAVVLGTVVFGGTTWAYFVGKRQPHPPTHGPVQSLSADRDTSGARRDAYDEAA